jgi:adenine-specific DNA-methyltransferase
MEISNITDAFKVVQILINDFEDNINHYLSPSYQEAEVRKEFIDKFFTSLGWDVDHNFQKNPQQQEVKIEKAQRQQGAVGQKRADYSFSLAPNFKQTRFFVEAKKPSRSLRKNPDDYFQTAKYGWNAGTGVSILTDFEEIVIIDCRYKPDIDTILSTQIKYYRFTEFRDEDIFKEFYWIFSREAVLAGNLEKYIDDLPKPKGVAKQLKMFGGKYQSIDESFLNYIDEKRQELATAFYNNNKLLDAYSLTEATQRTIDRIVFIRFLEDKLIETESHINTIANSSKPWVKFIEISKQLNVKYNGIVFKPLFIDEKGFLGADENLFKSLCSELDNTNSPYDFNYIPIHILGSIYERFLGKVVTVSSGKAEIEEKPQVRKAGGVFYTPKYVVDYIISQNIGKLIEGKTPKQISEFTFADISCGSGSFLIGAFDYLLDYHNRYYNINKEQAKRDGCKFDQDTGSWVLSIKQKQQILLNNIYGVDIDLQATEVTQLSLFLKMLEDETTATANDMMVLFHETILPNLTNNIKCGNSLIGSEILAPKLDLDLEYERKLNPFDFSIAFPKVFNKGGFDVLVGNPPYVKEYTEREIFEGIKLGKLAKYYQGKMDLWYFFVCYGLDLLKENGLLGYITPNNWVSNSGASILRNKVINDSQIISIIDFNDFMVFKDASIQTMILNLQKSKDKNNYSFYQQVFNVKKLKEVDVINDLVGNKAAVSIITNPKIERKQNLDTFLKFDNDSDVEILNKIKSKRNFILDEKTEVAQGIVAPQDFVNKKSQEALNNSVSVGDGIFVLSNDELNNLNLPISELKLIKPYYTSEDFDKYYVKRVNSKWIIYTDSSFKDITLMNDYPKLKAHLDRFKTIITSDNRPYGLHRSRNPNIFIDEKIISVRKCVTPTFIYSDSECYVSQTFNIIKSKRINLKYLTALLNSNLIKFWLYKKGKMQGSLFQIDKEPIMNIPICITKDTEIENKITSLVDQMIQVKKLELISITERDKNFIHQKCLIIDNQINDLVYMVYDIEDKKDKEVIETTCSGWV